MNIEVKISKRPIPYKTAINYLEKRVEKIKLGKGSGDTEHFAEFRKFLVDEGYDLDTVLDKIYICFINLKGVGKEKIAAMETRILETRIAKGQCRCNGAKRMPALTNEELTYFDNL